MKISIRGKNKVLTRSEIREAVIWMASLIMHPRTVETIRLTIVHEILTDDHATLQHSLRSKFPRSFLLKLDPSGSRRQQLMTLAHELVHVKQYVRGEMRDHKYYVQWYSDRIDDEATDYWDYPWEIEARGREYGMYRRYCDYLREQAS